MLCAGPTAEARLALAHLLLWVLLIVFDFWLLLFGLAHLGIYWFASLVHAIIRGRTLGLFLYDRIELVHRALISSVR